ncbi:hypothetical protein sscle_03g027830 [Sclerotinia sclerotiorum 1980 UF-70]|uniref:Mid2 domain-containing protein n=1 Tax=Sclerotinia sclerotiorum (strain ATCC 18683 / 1980 / Ss-1) TaxID=665079 RepID=A0A1D9Q0E5_SCLS1|nr:hypothetical protein sscle_03g027830 [Sclerotinia sclerotiorum 1980 UF-70]
MAAISARSKLIARDHLVNSFINPLPQKDTFIQDYSDNLDLKEGSTIDLVWISNYTSIVLSISQVLKCLGGELGCNSNSTLLQSIPKSPNMTSWTIDSSPYNLTESNIFYFSIHNGNTRNNIAAFTSRYFNISTSNDIPAVTDTAPSLSAKRHEVADPVSTIDLPVGAEIGIGLGIGVVSFVVVLAIALIFRHIRRSRCRRHAAKNPRISIVNAGDNLRIRRESWVQALQNTFYKEHRDDSSQYRWDSPDDVMPRYDSPDLREERGVFDEVRLENSEEYIDSQNNQYINRNSDIHLSPGEGVASPFINVSCGSWSNSLDNSLADIFQVLGVASSNYQQYQNCSVAQTNSQPRPSQYSRHQLERYIPRKTSIKLQRPMPTYAPWHQHELIHRSNSIWSIQ